MSNRVSAPPVASAPAPPAPPKAAPCKAFTLGTPDATSAASTPAAAPAAPPLPAGPLSPATESAKRVITRMLDDEAKVDRGLHAAMSGRQMSAPELLVLQAQVIQYSQEVEVASRVVDKATGAVKQVLQTQV